MKVKSSVSSCLIISSIYGFGVKVAAGFVVALGVAGLVTFTAGVGPLVGTVVGLTLGVTIGVEVGVTGAGVGV